VSVLPANGLYQSFKQDCQNRGMSEVLHPTLLPLSRACTLAGLLCAGLPVGAQTAPSNVTDLGRIEIRSNRDNDVEMRREATASKIVIGREEIEKQGDATIGEVLKRLPGVTMGGPPGSPTAHREAETAKAHRG